MAEELEEDYEEEEEVQNLITSEQVARLQRATKDEAYSSLSDLLTSLPIPMPPSNPIDDHLEVIEQEGEAESITTENWSGVSTTQLSLVKAIDMISSLVTFLEGQPERSARLASQLLKAARVELNGL